MLAAIIKTLTTTLTRRPALSAVAITALYLILFQLDFVLSGDSWAESFAEYLEESLTMGWSEVFAQNWAGYFTIVPSFLSKLYVTINAPLGYIDYFHRLITIVFALCVSGLIAARYNRAIIANDYHRILFAVGSIMLLFDVASFSFINVWYIGFIPVILYCLHTQRLERKNDIIIGVFGALMSLTKPLPLLIPLLLLRMYRTRQYAGSIVILIASIIQTYQIIFNDRREIVEQITFSLLSFLGGMFNGSGVEFLKLFKIEPSSIVTIIAANILLVILLVSLAKRAGVFIPSVISVVYFYFIYAFIFAPDALMYSGIFNFMEIYLTDFKTQRELMIHAIILLLIFMSLPYIIDRFRGGLTILLPTPEKKRIFTTIFSIALPLIIVVAIYRPIDVTSSGVAPSQIEPFRHDLNIGRPTCIPITPTPTFYYAANWYFDYKGACSTMNFDLNFRQPDFTKMNRSLGQPQDFVLDQVPPGDITAIVIPVRTVPNHSAVLRLTDEMTGVHYLGKVYTVHSKDNRQFVSFNILGAPARNTYRFSIVSDSDNVWAGHFTATDDIINYAYFITKP